jgi:hypothetical protein
MVNRDYAKIKKVLELGEQTLNIERIINASRYTPQEKEVSKILHEIKEDLIQDIIDIYSLPELIPELIPEVPEVIPEVKRKTTRTKK